MITNQHLNVFRFFNEEAGTEFIENNLTRALAICLKEDLLFFNLFLKEILTSEDYEYLFAYWKKDESYILNVQIETGSIETESYNKIYAVAITGNKDLGLNDILNTCQKKEKKNYTDIFIGIKDIGFVIEVKRNNEDCKQQLFNQIIPFHEVGIPICPKSYCWQDIIVLMDTINNIERLTNKQIVFIPDFLELIQKRFPYWFEAKPFNQLPFSTNNGSANYVQLVKRMKQAFAVSEYEVLPYQDRFGISVNFKWASEIIPDFYSYPDEKECVAFSIWPGNTKQQGYHIFYKSLAWAAKNEIFIDGMKYKIEVAYHIKLSHYNRFVSGVNFYNEDLKEPMYSLDNFKNNSGKWDRNMWKEFEDFMDKYLNKNFKWREKLSWENITASDRQYFTSSLGYEVVVFVPYSKFTDIDKKQEDIIYVAQLVNKIAQAFKNLI